jgi:hypothetical protein
MLGYTWIKKATLNELRTKAYVYDEHRKELELLKARTHHLRRKPERKNDTRTVF